jgi:hypothetical protein
MPISTRLAPASNADASSSPVPWVAVGTTDERQARRSRHLDDGGAAGQAPRGIDGVAERAHDDRLAVAAAQHVERALSAVGQRQRRAGSPHSLDTATHRRRRVGG